MSNAIKLIIPFINDNLTLEDFNEASGFIDGYVYDINRPSLTNHTFLMYDGLLDTKEKLLRNEKLVHLDNLYSMKTVYISKKPYIIYTFHNMNKCIDTVINGSIPCGKDFSTVFSFWKANDDFINSLIINREKSVDLKNSIVPEWDYRKSIEDEFLENNTSVL